MRSMLRRIGQVLALGSKQRGALLAASASLAAMHLSLRFLGFRRSMRLWRIDGAPTGTSAIAGDEPALALSAWAVDASARHGPCAGSCLSRSLTLLYLLRRRGVRGTLRIGVAKTNGRVDGHAWVEYHGRALNDSPSVALRYPPLI